MADLSGTPPPYAGKTDLEVLEAALVARRRADEHGAGSANQRLQAMIFETAMNELTRRQANSTLDKIREQGGAPDGV